MAAIQSGQTPPPVEQPQQPPQQAPQQQGYQPGPMSLTGNPQQDMAMYAMNPQEYTKSVIAAHAPVDFAKLLQQAGIDPLSPLGRQIMQSQLAKQNYIAPINGRPGSTIRDPNDPSRILGYDAPSINGAFPTYGANGMPTGYQQAPGAVQAQAAMEGATAGAKAAAQAPYELVTVIDPNTGASFQQPKSTITGGAGAPAGAPSGGGLNGYYGAPSGAPMGNQSGLGPGQQSANTTAGTNSANGFNDAIKAGENAKNAMRTINNIMTAANGIQTGTGAGTLSEVKSGLNVVLPKSMQFDTRDIAKFDEIKKNAASLGDQLSGAAGGGTDARLKNALDSLPNANYSPAAIQEVATNLKGLQAAALGRDRKSTRLNSSHIQKSRMPSSA